MYHKLYNTTSSNLAQYFESETNWPFGSQYDNSGAPGQQKHNALSHTHTGQNNLTVKRPKIVQQSKDQKGRKFYHCQLDGFNLQD